MVTELAAGFLCGLIGYAIGKDGKTLVPVSQAEVNRMLQDTKPEFLKKVDIDTSIARTGDETSGEYPIAGSFIFVQNPSVPALPVYIKLNEPGWLELPISGSNCVRRIVGPFYRFFIRNSAGKGTLNLVIAKGYQFQFTEGVTDTKSLNLISFDRQGDVVYIDDFEAPIEKYIDASYGTGSKAILDSTVAKSGAQSIKLITGGTINQYSRTQHYMSPMTLGRHGLEISASLHRMDAFASTFVLWLETYTGTQLVNAKIQIDVDGGTLKCYDENGTWQTFESGLELYTLYSYIFHDMKMVVDLNTNKYVRFLIDSLSYDLSAYTINTLTNTRAPYSVAVFTLTDLYGRAWGCWMDDLVFTVNEP